MTAPLVAPPEAQPAAHQAEPPIATEAMARPFRLGVVGLGTAVGLFVRLLAANGIGELNSSEVMLGAAATSALIGIGALLMAAERDRFGAPLAWISLITALAWAALNWISPPFADSVFTWNQTDQTVLAVVGAGNGLLLAGIVALAFVRRHPTLTVGVTLIAATLALGANTVLLRNEWPAIVALGLAFALILVAWDRSPRREQAFVLPENPPRVSRAVLSFVSVALCGAAIQFWTSRTDIPQAIPAIVLAALLLIGAFASLMRVRREIEQRDTTLSEWTSWFREVRSSDFRAEMQNFESAPSAPSASAVGESPFGDAPVEPPRKLSFPGLDFADGDSIDDAIGQSIPQPVQPTAPELSLPSAELPAPATTPEFTFPQVKQTAQPQFSLPQADLPQADPPATPVPVASAAPAKSTGGAFSSILAPSDPAPTSAVADLSALQAWLDSPVAAARVTPLLVAIEAMSLDEYDSLPPSDAAMATTEIGSFLADAMPDADLVSWIDGPYFIVAYASKPNAELLELNRAVLKSLKATDGTLALVRPSVNAELDDLVNEAVMGLLHARRAKDRAAGR